jgi:hypothetical protein
LLTFYVAMMQYGTIGFSHISLLLPSRFHPNLCNKILYYKYILIRQNWFKQNNHNLKITFGHTYNFLPPCSSIPHLLSLYAASFKFEFKKIK